MWKQINLTEALQGFLAGRTVKIVDFGEEAVVSLQDVFKSMQESAVFFMEEDKAPAIVPPDKLVEWVVDGPPDEESSAEEPEPPKTSKKKQLEEAEQNFQKRKITDLGKLRSLRAAGWDVEKIATEFGCSGQTVRNTMKREGIE